MVSTPTDTRLRTAVVLSVFCLAVAFLGFRALDVRLGPDDGDKALAMMVPALGLALTSVTASWLLVAALLERRPAWGDRQGRWLWAWTLVFWLAFIMLGLMNSASQTIGQTGLYTSGLLVGLIGFGGLVISALPRWNRRVTPRRTSASS